MAQTTNIGLYKLGAQSKLKDFPNLYNDDLDIIDSALGYGFGVGGNSTVKGTIDNVSNRFTVVSTGSLHDIRETGMYWLADAVTDKPVSAGGYYSVVSFTNSVLSGIYTAYNNSAAYLVTYYDGAWKTTPIQILGNFYEYNSSSINIDNPPVCIGRFTSSCSGTTPLSVIGGSQWVIYTMFPDTTANYNAQVAFSYARNSIAIRRKNNSSTWSAWIRLDNTTEATSATTIASMVGSTVAGEVKTFTKDSGATITDYPSSLASYKYYPMVRVTKCSASVSYVEVFGCSQGGTPKMAYAYCVNGTLYWNA